MELDLHFGPFTCIAGENGVGKSNIFDVLQFISYLADYPVIEAADRIRGSGTQVTTYGTLTDIFRRSPTDQMDRIHIAVEMIVPSRGTDELGQAAEATGNYLRYELELRLRTELDGQQTTEITREQLLPMKKGAAARTLKFPHAPKWREQIIYNNRRGGPYISTDTKSGDTTLINLHQDGGSAGKPSPFGADTLPRTILSTARYASETPTVLLARREMQSWKFLQLEPTALRRPTDLDRMKNDLRVGSNGADLAGVAYRLARMAGTGAGPFPDSDAFYATLANRLAQLIKNVREVRVDKDDKRRILTLELVTKDHVVFPARSLSDGTLRFLALSLIEADYTEESLICLEEPENGIHPDRIPTMIELLQDLAFDPMDPEDAAEEPLRQVIVNTHSPGVVAEVPKDDLVFVELKEYARGQGLLNGTSMRALRDSWRVNSGGMRSIRLATLLSYLAPIQFKDDPSTRKHKVKHSPGALRLFELTEDNGIHD